MYPFHETKLELRQVIPTCKWKEQVWKPSVLHLPCSDLHRLTVSEALSRLQGTTSIVPSVPGCVPDNTHNSHVL
jgi:hypothetical protein